MSKGNKVEERYGFDVSLGEALDTIRRSEKQERDRYDHYGLDKYECAAVAFGYAAELVESGLSRLRSELDESSEAGGGGKRNSLADEQSEDKAVSSPNTTREER